MPGQTAHACMIGIGRVAAGETVVISAAGGGVGSIAGQIGKILGARVVGIAGGPEKCKAVEALGFDACVDYKSPDYAANLAAACPGGIDVYIENVGGAVTQAVLPLLKYRARVPVCGFIAYYGVGREGPGPDHLPGFMRTIMSKGLELRGFGGAMVGGQAALDDLAKWFSEGKIRNPETIVEGLENATRRVCRGFRFQRLCRQTACARRRCLKPPNIRRAGGCLPWKAAATSAISAVTPAHDGKHTRWGMIYRSGSLAGLTPAGRDHLFTLGVKALCDLRSTRERVAEPYDWCEPAGIVAWSRDYETSFGELRTLMASSHATAEAARAAMFTGYRGLPYEQAPAYREVFRCLAAGHLPLVFNCSAGKDRAGTAAALILSALGVPRDIVVRDYAVSDKVVDFKRIFLTGKGAAHHLASQPEGVADAILMSDPAYIETALSSIDERSGSLEAYLQEQLDVTPDMLTEIRARLLT